MKSENFDRANMIHMADQVAEYNQKFKDKNRPYLLLGPGRWGTSDQWLGIPDKVGSDFLGAGDHRSGLWGFCG